MGRVVAGDAGDFAAAVLTGASEIEAIDRSAIVGEFGEGAIAEELVRVVMGVPDVAIIEGYFAFQILGSAQLVVDD